MNTDISAHTDRPVCEYCGAYADIAPLGRTTKTWHDSAECVNMVEPMGRCQ